MEIAILFHCYSSPGLAKLALSISVYVAILLKFQCQGLGYFSQSRC